MASQSLLDINNSLLGGTPPTPATPPVITKPPVTPSLTDINNAGLAGKLPMPPAPPPDATVGSVAGQFGADINSDIADVVGAPMDFGVAANKAAMNVGQWAKSLTGQAADYSKQPYVPPFVPTSEHIKNWMNDIGAGTADTMPAPQNLPEKMARGAGQNVAQLMEMYGGGQALLNSGIKSLYPALGAALENFVTGLAPFTQAAKPEAGATLMSKAGNFAKDVWKGTAPAAKTLGLGAAAGAGGQAAEEVAPDGWKPLANLVGQGLTAAGGAGSLALLQKGVGVAAPMIGDAWSAMTKAGQQRLAGQALRGAATDQGMTGANIEAGAEPTVPGSQPTIGMASGDPGLMQLERTVAQKNPGPYQERTSANNLARVQAMQGLAPEDANPQAAKDFFKSQYDAADSATAQVESAAKAEAQAKLDLVNGVGSPEQYGAAMRNQLLAQKNAAKASASNLWQAIDPDGKATVDITPFKTASYDLRSAMPQVAKPMGGEEKAIFDAVDGLPQVAPFSDLQALDSRIGAEIRTVRGTPGGDLQSLRRLQILKDSIRDTMAGFVENQGTHDAAAMNAGALSPQQSIFARIQQFAQAARAGDDGSPMARQAAAGDNGPGAGSPNADAGYGAVPTNGVGAIDGEGISPQGGPGSPAGNQSVPLPNPKPATAPTASPALADRYKAAKAATLSLKQKFSQGPVAPVLQPGPRGAPFATMDSAVGDRLFAPGPKGGQTIAAYQKAGGDLGKLQDYITWNLRQAAVKNGELDGPAYDRWVAKYGTALDALPPKVKAPFQNAAMAQKAVDDAAATRVDTMRQLKDGELKAWLKDQDPQQAVGQTIGDAGKWGQLVARAKTAPDADILDSLKRNTIDYMLSKTQGGQLGVGTDEGLLKGDTLRKFVDTNRRSLSQLFTPEQMNVLDNVVSDIQRQNQIASSSKLPFGSNTAQDLAAAGRLGPEATPLDHIMKEVIGAGIGAVAGGPAGAVGGGFAARVLSKFGGQGSEKVQKLIAQAVLDPKFGLVLLSKVGAAKPSPLIMNTLRARLAAMSAEAGTQYSNKKAVGQ